MADIYVSSYRWTNNVAAWQLLHAYSVGDLVRQSATPTVGNERVFRCTTAGTSGATEPSWTLTQGSTTNDSSVVWTEVTGQSTYGWNAPHARLANALSWGANGDNFYLDGGVSGVNPHAETQSTAMTTTLKGTTATPIKILSVDSGASPPTALAAGASITTTGTSTMTIQLGYAYVYGVTFNCGTGGSTSSLTLIQGTGAAFALHIFDNCSFKLVNTGGGSRIQLGALTSSGLRIGSALYKTCSFLFSATSQGITPADTNNDLLDCTFASSGSVPTSIFIGNTSAVGIMLVRDSDLSAITGTLFNITSAVGVLLKIFDCLLASGVTPISGTNLGTGGGRLAIRNSDSSGTNYRLYDSDYSGSFQQETTTVRTGGASDGTTGISHNFTSNTNTTAENPLTSPNDSAIFSEWIDTTGSSKTATIEFASSSALTNNDIWFELEYLGSSASPKRSLISSRVSPIYFGTPSNYSSSSESWGGSPANKQKMSVSFTPQMKGFVRARIFLAKASTTVYVDPKITIT